MQMCVSFDALFFLYTIINMVQLNWTASSVKKQFSVYKVVCNIASEVLCNSSSINLWNTPGTTLVHARLTRERQWSSFSALFSYLVCSSFLPKLHFDEKKENAYNSFTSLWIIGGRLRGPTALVLTIQSGYLFLLIIFRLILIITSCTRRDC